MFPVLHECGERRGVAAEKDEVPLGNLLELDNSLDLRGHVEGQHIRAHRGTSMAAILAKDLCHEIRCPIDHLWLVIVVRGRVDKADELDNLLDLLEISAASSLGLRQDVEAACAGTLICLIGAVGLGNLANILELSVDHGNLACNVDVLAGDNVWAVVCCGRGGLGCMKGRARLREEKISYGEETKWGGYANNGRQTPWKVPD
jgi:hypothetical protein